MKASSNISRNFSDPPVAGPFTAPSTTSSLVRSTIPSFTPILARPSKVGIGRCVRSSDFRCSLSLSASSVASFNVCHGISISRIEAQSSKSGIFIIQASESPSLRPALLKAVRIWWVPEISLMNSVSGLFAIIDSADSRRRSACHTVHRWTSLAAAS